MDEITDRLKKWWNLPFNEQGDVFDWFLFVGLIIVMTFFWHRILERIIG